MSNDNSNNQQQSAVQAEMTLNQLADRIVLVDETLRQQAAHAVNCMLTARNWFIGFYIVEFEQHGANRAQYGEQLLKTLAKRINRKGMTWRRLYEYRTFYKVYPQLHSEILRYLQSQMQRPTELPAKKLRSLPAIFQTVENEAITKLQSLTAISPEPWQTAPDRLFHRIGYTSLQMLSEISDPLKQVLEARSLHAEFLPDAYRRFESCPKVRVKAGDFEGFEGRVFRIRHDRKLIISLDDMAIAISGIHHTLLEIVG